MIQLSNKLKQWAKIEKIICNKKYQRLTIHVTSNFFFTPRPAVEDHSIDLIFKDFFPVDFRLHCNILKEFFLLCMLAVMLILTFWSAPDLWFSLFENCKLKFTSLREIQLVYLPIYFSLWKCSKVLNNKMLWQK